MSALCIQAKDVTKKFGDNVALSNINLSIEEGEFFSFLGPSGCGKTTLLRIIAGFESLTSGSLLIDGQDVSKIPAHNRPVNMVFQNYALFPHLTIADNVAFGLVARGNKDKSDIQTKVKEALQLVRLDQFASRHPQQLSGGQQQRVALARAVINRPRVLLLDEPLSALDPQIREQMQEELKSLQRTLNLTFIMVTHDQNEALAMSHRIAVFSAGKLEQVGQPQDIYKRPASAFVARFIGQTNLIKMQVKQISGREILLDGGTGSAFSVLLEDSSVTKTSRPPEVQSFIFLCVKPESIQIVPSASSILQESDVGINSCEAQVEGVSYQGHTTEFSLKLLNGSQIKAIIAAPESEIKVGDKVKCIFKVIDCSYLNDTNDSASTSDLAMVKV